jgi:hypothetical protein
MKKIWTMKMKEKGKKAKHGAKFGNRIQIA